VLAFSIDEDNPVPRRNALSQLAGHDDATDARSEDDNRLWGGHQNTSVLSAH
jgi:hypothetical protein